MRTIDAIREKLKVTSGKSITDSILSFPADYIKNAETGYNYQETVRFLLTRGRRGSLPCAKLQEVAEKVLFEELSYSLIA